MGEEVSWVVPPTFHIGGGGPIPSPKVYPSCFTCPNPTHYDHTPWWTDDDLRNPDFQRGSYWSVVVPGLPFVKGNVPWSGGSSEHPERLITGLDYKYDRDQWWPKMTGETLRRGFNSWLRWWGNARVDGGNSIDQFVQDCQLLQEHGIQQVKVALWAKDADPHDMSADQLKSYFTPILDALLSNNCVQEILPGMEWNFGNVPGGPTYDFFKWLGQQCHAHGVKMGLHFSSHVPAWQPPGHDWREMYNFLGADVDYLNYQAELVSFSPTPPSPWDIGEFQARMVDIMKFFGQSGNQWKIRATEFSALLSFSGDHPNEDEHNSLGYLASCTVCPDFPGTHVWGSGDGMPYEGQ